MNQPTLFFRQPGARGLRRLACAAVLLPLVWGLSACGSRVRLDQEAPVETRVPTIEPNPAGGANANAVPGGGAGNASALPQSKVATVVLPAGGQLAVSQAGAVPVDPKGNIVYFGYDSFAIRDEDRPVLDQRAKLLRAQPKRQLLIEGHTDERGGREYNLALGQKRAEAVQRALLLLGVADGQLEAVSLGKERPADQGGTEAAWARNRRAELKDR